MGKTVLEKPFYRTFQRMIPSLAIYDFECLKTPYLEFCLYYKATIELYFNDL